MSFREIISDWGNNIKIPKNLIRYISENNFVVEIINNKRRTLKAGY